MPKNLITITGDILTADIKYICHQTCCVICGENKGRGLYKALVEKYPECDIYARRAVMSIPGQIDVMPIRESDSYVIHMHAQYYPGIAKYNNDTSTARLAWFHQCLNHIANITNINEIAFPYLIGCGLAGGEWNAYYSAIRNFAKSNPHIMVYIYKLANLQSMSGKSKSK